MKNCIEHIFTGETVVHPAYDSTKTVIGKLFRQYQGPAIEDNFISPIKMTVGRPLEASTPITCANPIILRRTDDLEYVLLSENKATAVFNRIVLYTFNRVTSEWVWSGFITLNFPQPTGTYTIKGFSASRTQYITGTVAVSGTAVTGSGGTQWNAAKLCAGSRIGFGSTEPEDIVQWYEIASVNSDTSITLVDGTTIVAGTPYVVDEWRIAISVINTVVANGGLYIVKGLRPEIFTTGGTTILPATTIDRQRAVYWLADAATVTNTSACGIAEDDEGTTWSNRTVYVLNYLTRACYVYNIRADLTPVNGKFVGTLVKKTGTATLTGTLSQINNGVVATAGHGAGNGVRSIYFCTTTRVYRAALTDIVDGSTNWTTDVMVEIPPGGTTTFILTNTLSFIEYSSLMDRFIICSSGASGNRSYVSRYYTDSSPLDNMFLIDAKNTDQSAADSDNPVFPSINGTIITTWSERGLVYVIRQGTTAALNQIYAVPIGAHWGFVDGEYVITPAMSTASASKFYRLYVNGLKWYGANEFRVPTDVYRVSYRTAGISDNSGTWTLLPQSLDLTGVDPSSEIQFKIEFRVIGGFSLTARILSLALVYESDEDLPSQYIWNYKDMNTTDGTVGFVQTQLFGGAVPLHTISYYRTDNGALLLTQDSDDTTNGTFEYWDGGAWVAGLGTDTVGIRRRFVASAGLPTGVNVYPKIATE